ncbi:MAG: hypothetical protein H8E98_02610 [Bacteroidetes bacterium]|nr:hypothetical protein [Bacteroidota bacterium]
MNKVIEFLISLSDIEINIFNNNNNNELNPYNKPEFNVIQLLDKESKRKQLKSIWNTLNDGIEKETKDDGKITIQHYVSSNIKLKIKDLSYLSTAYKIIKNVYPDYKYKLENVFVFGHYVDIEWLDENYPLIRIELTTTVEDFPKELASENCGFETRQVTEYNYVCR